MNWKVAIVVCAAVALLLASALGLVSSGGRYYFAEVDWERVESMPYSEAQKYLMGRSEEISRLQSLGNAIYYPEFWYGVFLDALLYMLLGLVCCWLYQRYSQPNKAFERTP